MKIPLVLIFLFGLCQVLPGAGNSAKIDINKQLSDFNHSLYWSKVWCQGYGSLDYHRDIERIFNMYKSTISALKEQKHFLFASNPPNPVQIPRENILNVKIINKQSRPCHTHLNYLYDIDDDFKNLTNFFKVGSDIYFFLYHSMSRSKVGLNGIYRINKEKWYDPVKGTKLDLVIEWAKNRLLGYYFDRPTLMFGFRENFSDDFPVSLPDIRLRQEIFKLNEKTFLFHNARFNLHTFAVEIYNLKGERIRECFNYIPCHIKSSYNSFLAAQTVLAADQRGFFYIGFQYPGNPYKIWKYNENGLNTAVLGNNIDNQDIYEFPEEWFTWNSSEIEYYGISKLYAIEKLLCDEQGRLFVIFTINRIARKNQKEKATHCFIDIYSEKGDFIDRCEFKYGIPQLIDRNIIYSRMETSPNTRKITVVAFEIKSH